MKILKKIILVILLTIFVSIIWSRSLQTGLLALPVWSKSVFSINITKVTSDPEFYNALKDDSEFQKMKSDLKDVGIDIINDNIKLYAGVSEFSIFPNKNKPYKEPDFVVILEVRYNERKLIKKIKQKAKKENKKITQENIAGYTVLTNSAAADKFRVALIKGKAIIIASPSKIREAIDLVQGRGSSVADNRKLYSVIESVKGNNLFWGVTEISQDMKKIATKKGNDQEPGMPPTFKKILKIVEDLNFVNITSNIDNDIVKLAIEAVGKDEQTAKQLEESLNELKLLFAMFLPPKVFDKLEVNQNNKSAGISISLSKDELKQLSHQAHGNMKEEPIE